MKRAVVEIKFDRPSGVTQQELREFIKDALGSWGGARHPDDLLFHSLKRITVQFKAQPAPR